MFRAIRGIDRDLPVYALKSMNRELFEETSGVRLGKNYGHLCCHRAAVIFAQFRLRVDFYL